ncbi:GNAT family N-acetyltransferase [Paenibacillus sp. Y412MC10]|uniref:GNAT family N-acetyltransferase n=1 Tax=Geobacillus sp. (strain Y412MC10) TaxID=481743 RepID=UPI0011A4DCCD|nr:GNAT family protein [Paenibacillus sp. Y412MC10]
MYKAIVNEDTYISILEDRHANELYHLIDSSRESIRQWLQFPDLTHKVEDTRAFISRSLKRFANNDGYWAGIWYKGQIAGSIGFLGIDWEAGRTEIGYWLGSPFEGKGLMTSACRTFVAHTFHDLRLRKVEIGAAVGNIRSRAIPERLGFTQEGIIRNYERLHDQYLDRVVYGLTQQEWLDLQAMS